MKSLFKKIPLSPLSFPGRSLEVLGWWEGEGGGVHVCARGGLCDGMSVPILASPALFPHPGEGSSGVAPTERRQAAWDLLWSDSGTETKLSAQEDFQY